LLGPTGSHPGSQQLKEKQLSCAPKLYSNAKDKVEIEAASQWKVVSQKKEYDKTMLDKMEEMRQMYGGRRGEGGRVEMRFGH